MDNIKIAKELVKMAKSLVADYEVMPQDGSKSFYRKAIIKKDAQGREVLYSYDTPVLRKEKDGSYTRLWDGWSATTGRHIKSWANIDKKEWDKMEVVDIDAKDGDEWQVWSYDTWGNENDGWEVNDRRRAFTFVCYSDDEYEIEKCFEKAMVENGYRVKNFDYEWNDEDSFEVNDAKNGKYLFGVEKI